MALADTEGITIFERSRDAKAINGQVNGRSFIGALFKKQTYAFLITINILAALGLIAVLVAKGVLSVQTVSIGVITMLSILMTIHGIITLFWTLYAWEDPDRVEKNKSPKEYEKPFYSFTALIPARHEKGVIEQTIQAVANIEYPAHLKEIIVICRFDDEETIEAAKRAIDNIHMPSCKLIVFYDQPINKPHGLNIGLKDATKDIVVIFDAEDEPHKDIYQIVNTVMRKESVDVVQCGVQLMNFNSSWFSTLNVLEYFFWFKSTLQFFSRAGIIPLGGNTVFFKRVWLDRIGGWDETCLTEDADIGIRLSVAGAKIRVVYDEQHATQEETPPDVTGFIHQRTRWNQGFIQVLLKGDWAGITNSLQRLLAVYVLIWPEVQAVLFLYIPLSIIMILMVKLPVLVAMLSTLPLYLLGLQLVTYNIGLYEFTRDYKLPYSLLAPLHILLSFYPFQIILGVSALRAVLRMLAHNIAWEKTMHLNAHREMMVKPAYA